MIERRYYRRSHRASPFDSSFFAIVGGFGIQPDYHLRNAFAGGRCYSHTPMNIVVRSRREGRGRPHLVDFHLLSHSGNPLSYDRTIR